MSDDADGFTAEPAAAATGVLRAALGLAPQRFAAEQFVGMISDEVEQLRAAGKTDGEIAALLADGAGIAISSEAIGRFYVPPAARGRPA